MRVKSPVCDNPNCRSNMVRAYIRPVCEEFREKHPSYEGMLRGITDKEYRIAIECAKKYGLHMGIRQNKLIE